MSEEKFVNYFSFAPQDGNAEVFLQVESDWVQKAGVQPDVNSAIVSYKEFNKLFEPLTGKPRGKLNGEIKLYYSGSGSPDHTISNQRIIQIEPVTMAVSKDDAPDDGPHAVEYRLFFADWRADFQWPRGGRLFDGELNPDSPKDDPDSDDGTPDDVVPNSELISRCLKAMGIDSDGPAGADDIEPLHNLQWLGAHPAEELQKLLDHTGYTLCPTNDKTECIQQIGGDSLDEPEIPEGRELPELSLYGVGRSGKTVVITSAPTAVLECFEYDPADSAGGPSVGTLWSFVAQDFDDDTNPGKWVKLADHPHLTDNPADAIKNNFKDVNAKYQKQLRDQVYHFLQLDKTKYPPSKCPIHRKHHKKPKVDGDTVTLARQDLAIYAKIAQQQPDHTWTNTSDFARINIQWLADSNVIFCAERIGLLDTATASDPNTHFKSVREQDLKINFSVEAYDSDLDIKEYFCVGFKQGAAGDEGADDAGITQLSDDDTKGIIANGGEDAIVIEMPELRYFRTNGVENDKLKEQLTAKAKAKAAAIISGSGDDFKTRTAVGFVSAEVSGKTAEIRWNQQACTTTFKINAWWMPSTALRRDALERLKTGTFPEQHSTHASRAALGASGEQQPAVPIAPPPAALPVLVGDVVHTISIGDDKEPPDDPSETKYEIVNFDGQKKAKQITLGDDKGAEIFLSMGNAYHDEGDEKWYEYKIRLLLDSRLNIREVGPISKVVVDVPDTCPGS